LKSAALPINLPAESVVFVKIVPKRVTLHGQSWQSIFHFLDQSVLSNLLPKGLGAGKNLTFIFPGDPETHLPWFKVKKNP